MRRSFGAGAFTGNRLGSNRSQRILNTISFIEIFSFYSLGVWMNPHFSITNVRPEWLGPFYGDHVGFSNYEIRTIQHIDKRLCKEEADLMQVKWWDYARLHPMQATYYFARCFNKAYSGFVRLALDEKVAPYQRGIAEIDFLRSRERNAIWRLRQMCDRLGMRYDFFLRHAMEYRFKQGWLRPPRPCHITSDADMLAHVSLAWEELPSIGLQVANDPYFRAEHWRGHAIQRRHEDFVVRQIKRRRLKSYALHSALYVRGVLRIERALTEFEESDVAGAVAEVGDNN